MENKDWINDFEALKQVSKANPFTVPAGYFDDLENRIVSLVNITTNKGSSPEAGFTVPDGYFDDLASKIQSRITIEAALNTEETGFTAPEGYFDGLSANIQSRIATEEATAGK